jgi:UDP-N-acetylmuramoyl-L-alanyl-D-glutamate--2,6-diaminopimelate ligase
MQGVRHAGSVQVEADRAAAIALAIQAADARDVVLIAGKGHEDYQEVGGVKKPFSDLAQAAEGLTKRREAAGVRA